MLRELARTLLPNCAVLAVVTFTELELALKLLLLVLSIAWTALKIVSEWRKLRARRGEPEI